MIMTFWAAFGVPILMIIIAFLTRLIPNKNFRKKINTILLSALAVCWILGFILMILFLFANVSGIKQLFIWCVLCVSLIIFAIIHYKEIDKLIDDMAKKSKD